ncbi:hypothetical protein Q5P01_021498 [Channa striata]|uniref:Uncharacterized protein n=1 Tax=Channa striata TaxID=64152 RepID=A0AA88LVV9_CHASR|nr:hypothetical protein Q5P01_021498 [Channa striata]
MNRAAADGDAFGSGKSVTNYGREEEGATAFFRFGPFSLFPKVVISAQKKKPSGHTQETFLWPGTSRLRLECKRRRQSELKSWDESSLPFPSLPQTSRRRTLGDTVRETEASGSRDEGLRLGVCGVSDTIKLPWLWFRPYL